MGVEFLAVLLHDEFHLLGGQWNAVDVVGVGIDEGNEAVAALQHERFAHHRHRVKLVLDFFRVDVLSVRPEEHILDAALDKQVSVGREASEVAGVVPSVAVDGLACGLLVFVISQHDVHTPCDDLALVAVAALLTGAHNASVACL